MEISGGADEDQSGDRPFDPRLFAQLRPQMAESVVHRAMGMLWKGPDDEGHASHFDDEIPICSLRMSAESQLQAVSFYRAFPADIVIEGLHIGMTLIDAQRVRSGLCRAGEEHGIVEFRDETAVGDLLEARFEEGRLIGLCLSRPGMALPERPWKYADPELREAYNVWPEEALFLPQRERDTCWANGWCLGRPPGITTAQWPLSPCYGHPLRHAFTLYLPEAYRMQGPEYVAISLFVDDQSDELEEAGSVEGGNGDQPWIRDLYQRHPRSFPMQDLLQCHYCVIWLTQAEFDGPLAMPPDLADYPLLRGLPQPLWQRAESSGPDLLEALGESDESLQCYAHGTAHPISVVVRENDPNVGRPAREWDHENEDSGYIIAFSEEGDALNLPRFEQWPHHLGGTMIPVQGYPDFSPYYFEFGEELAWFNFGGGVGQLDLLQMKLDWAC